MADHTQALQWAYPGKGFRLSGTDATAEGKLTWLDWGNDPQPTAEEIAQKIADDEEYLEASLYFDTGLGFKLALSESAVLGIAQVSALADIRATAATPLTEPDVSLYDSDGTKRTITMAQFRTLRLNYGNAVAQAQGL